MTPFGQWLQTFMKEKEVDLSTLVTARDGRQTQAGNVVQSMMSATEAEQKAIRNAFVVIDYSDGNIMKFIDHLAKAGPADHFEQIAAEDFGMR
jgi:hypothetical protein